MRVLLHYVMIHSYTFIAFHCALLIESFLSLSLSLLPSYRCLLHVIVFISTFVHRMPGALPCLLQNAKVVHVFWTYCKHVGFQLVNGHQSDSPHNFHHESSRFPFLAVPSLCSLHTRIPIIRWLSLKFLVVLQHHPKNTRITFCTWIIYV
jgi:hypothetical protein